ncbi:hypothetical protein J4447_02790 [Candidatus Pacearchaeota archaeon]|nr:hypothetical protein [Candidatus Pacearchaeota archaeon]
MELKYILDEKNDAEIELDNPTVAEIMRVELAKDEEVKFVAWKREQPDSAVVILAVRTSGKTVRKALKDAAASIEKQLDKFLSDFKKAK